MATTRQEAIDHFLGESGFAGAERKMIAGDASFRRYERVFGKDANYILMDAPPEKEDVRPFLAIQAYYQAQQFTVPRIVAEDVTHGFLLLEDLGDDSFTKVLERQPEQEETLYHGAIDVLAEVKRQGLDSIAAGKAPEYDWKELEREIRVFGEWFLPVILGKSKAEIEIENFVTEMKSAYNGLETQPQVLVHRDFHADNLFWLDRDGDGVQRVGMLDFQDAVLGRPAYDMVSLLEDARRDIAPEVVDSSIARYIEKTGLDKANFMHEYAFFGAQRNAKILGVFMRLYLRDGKPRYLSMIPRVWSHLLRDLSHPAMKVVELWLDTKFTSAHRGLIASGNLRRQADRGAA